jgi:hypothetical protein
MHIFFGPVAQTEGFLVLRPGVSVSNEEEPCHAVAKLQSCRATPPECLFASLILNSCS